MSDQKSRPKVQCTGCRRSLAAKLDGTPYAHACVPYPTAGQRAQTREMDAFIVANHKPAEDEYTAPTLPKTTVSGQPEAQTNRYGYLLKDPETGDFRRYKNGNIRSITRVTTFNKAASDQNALTDWAKRNVLIGASLRPDIVLAAAGKAHDDKADLMKLVAQLEEAAGAKVSANIGTAVHKLTEHIDAGLITVADVPAAYRGHVQSYIAVLRVNGLSVVPDLIERTTFIKEFGGVAGSFDRVLFHAPSRTYVMGDLKTGKNMTYGWDEIETQEAIYTRGFNEFGVYDWNTDTWSKPDVRVRTDVGVVMWLPVQGESAGQCTLLRTDLERGWEHAKLCASVRAARSSKGKPEAWELPAAPKPDMRVLLQWEADFRRAKSKGELAGLYQAAYDAGLPEAELRALVTLGREVLFILENLAG